MTAKHTQGPWKVEHPDKAISRWTIVQPNGTSVADCAPAGPWVKNDEADANAALIAAAPELLAALKGLLDAQDKPTTAGDYYAARDAGRAAIAKAEGRS